MVIQQGEPSKAARWIAWVTLFVFGTLLLRPFIMEFSLTNFEHIRLIVGFVTVFTVLSDIAFYYGWIVPPSLRHRLKKVRKE